MIPIYRITEHTEHTSNTHKTDISTKILTISNKASDHSNDFVSLIVPFSFKCSKNNVPPPTNPNCRLVAGEETKYIFVA